MGFAPAWVRFPPYLKCKIHHNRQNLPVQPGPGLTFENVILQVHWKHNFSNFLSSIFIAARPQKKDVFNSSTYHISNASKILLLKLEVHQKCNFWIFWCQFLLLHFLNQFITTHELLLSKHRAARSDVSVKKIDWYYLYYSIRNSVALLKVK